MAQPTDERGGHNRAPILALHPPVGAAASFKGRDPAVIEIELGGVLRAANSPSQAGR